jgi:DNA-binding transcriptional MerR regulator
LAVGSRQSAVGGDCRFDADDVTSVEGDDRRAGDRCALKIVSTRSAPSGNAAPIITAMARAAASEEKLYKIGEVCKQADLQPYVLRYWETEFPQLSPNKSGGGQRLYTRRELDIILRIKELLYKEGFTIAGAKKRLEQEMAEPVAPVVASASPAEAAGAPQAVASQAPDVSQAAQITSDALARMKDDLRSILKMLEE